jgi:flagellar biosynthesis/type III secretory pathway M-ring protein FliF/YscJ
MNSERGPRISVCSTQHSKVQRELTTMLEQKLESIIHYLIVVVIVFVVFVIVFTLRSLCVVCPLLFV